MDELQYGLTGATLGVVFLQILRISVPYVLTSVGAVFSERGGVVNLALEGLMLAGAFGAAAGQHVSGSVLGGMAGALLLGLLVALLFAFITVTLKADQIVAGIAVNILVMGATRFGLVLLYGSSINSPRIPGLRAASLFLTRSSLLLSFPLPPDTGFSTILLMALGCVRQVRTLQRRTVPASMCRACGIRGCLFQAFSALLAVRFLCSSSIPSPTI